MTFDDPAQPPPRIGGLGWMRLPLPSPASLSIWRSRPEERAGCFVRLSGADGLRVYEQLEAERADIEAEFAEAGIEPPTWERDRNSATIAVGWPAPLPWTAEAEEQQAAALARTANQFVNSLRPRLERIARNAAAAA